MWSVGLKINSLSLKKFQSNRCLPPLYLSGRFDDHDWKTVMARLEELNNENLSNQLALYSKLLLRILQHTHVYKQPPPSECFNHVLRAIDRIIEGLNKLPQRHWNESDLLRVLRDYQLLSGTNTLSATCNQFLLRRKAVPSAKDITLGSKVKVRSDIW